VRLPLDILARTGVLCANNYDMDSSMPRLSLAVLTLVLCLPIVASAQSAQATPQKAVLVTGASTGIGRKVTERLAADGYFVYAGARKDADLDALGKIKNVQAVRMDVTKQEDIDAAVATIKKAGRGLYGLINNAGVGTQGSVIEAPFEEFELTMRVNAFGPWRVTKAFAPLIIAEKGRIATTGSISGILAGGTISAYVMSKHAIEGFTDSLAAEMAPLGVHVSVVEPGSYNTEIYRSAAKRLGGKYAARANDLDKLPEPDDVAAAFALALSEPKPKRRYLVVQVEDQARRTIKKQIAQLVELNEGHAYTYDRETLIKMLDEALVGSRPRTQ
jgi:NAD(P)-dependent dehydrogenase (short-subunit alcohol dehydrogenase family)